MKNIFLLFLNIIKTIPLSLLLIISCSLNPSWANETLKVGVFQNKPIVYYDDGAKGLFVEVLNYVAEKENWQIEYIPCVLDDCLNLLNKNEIDLMTSLGETPERLEYFDFSKESIWTFWGTVYSNDNKINGILDLKDKKIAVRKNNKTTQALQKLLDEFKIPVKYIEFDDYESAFKDLQQKSLDAVAVNNTYAFSRKIRNSLLHGTPIVFNPFSAYFAVSKNSGKQNLLKTIDKHVKELKANKSSIYHAFERKWFQVQQEPYWTGKRVGIISGIFLILTVLFMATWRFRSIVRVNEKLTNSIMQQKQIEAELLKQKGLLQKAQEIGQIGTWELDVIKNELTWTDQNYRIFGIPAGSNLTYEIFLNCVHPDDRDYVDKKWKEAFNKNSYDIEHRLLVDGKTKWVREKAELKFNENGEFIKGIGFTQDITDRKNTENLLTLSETKYRSMIESMDDPAYVCSKNFRVEYMNSAMMKRLGHDATGELCYEAMHKLDKKCPWCIHEKVMKGESIKTEVNSPKDNRSYNISNSPILNSEGDISKLTVFHDITEKKKLEKRLEQAQRMESIGNLAGGIAHDFNNILSPIVGMAELLLEDLSPDSIEHENANEILIAGMRGSELVKQILAFSQRSAHQLRPVRIQNVLEEVLKLTRSTIPINIEITHYIQKDCGFILADPTQIHQIAMNLITNAFHAVEETCGKIDVRLQEVTLEGDEWKDNQLQQGQYILLSIADNGNGMSKDTMSKIFEPYFTTKKPGKGTGLGLAVVYGIVKDHGGDIKVYSESGKGTTVNVYLPLINKTAQETSTNTTENIPTGTERILLIDDEAPILRLERQMLERLGYKVTEKTISAEALKVFTENPKAFDIVITDMTMPGMTGDQLARELIVARKDIPIIICTGFSERINKERAETIGVKGFLMKPIVKSNLAKMVRKILDEHKKSMMSF